MDKPTGPNVTYLAPGAPATQALHLPGRDAPLPVDGPVGGPNVSDYVVEPGTRQEMIDGVIIELAPAGVAHSHAQIEVGKLVAVCAREGYLAATELLTRTSERWNFAADVSVRKEGRDPSTGDRYLEEVIFEIRDSQTRKKLTARAKEMARRGVRRIFSIDAKLSRPGDDTSAVEIGPMKEWSPVGQAWLTLNANASIEDPVFVQPLGVQAFLDATAATDAITQALIASKPPALARHERAVRAKGYDAGKSDGYDAGKSDGYDAGKSDGYDAGKSDGYDAGKSDGIRTAIVSLCEAFGVSLTARRQAYLESAAIQPLIGLLDTLKSERRWPKDLDEYPPTKTNSPDSETVCNE